MAVAAHRIARTRRTHQPAAIIWSCPIVTSRPSVKVAATAATAAAAAAAGRNLVAAENSLPSAADKQEKREGSARIL